MYKFLKFKKHIKYDMSSVYIDKLVSITIANDVFY